MADEMYPEYENLNQFIEECMDYAKVTDPYDCDGYTVAELLVLSIQSVEGKKIDSLTVEIEQLQKALSKFGHHLPVCDLLNPKPLGRTIKCTCGFKEALQTKDTD